MNTTEVGKRLVAMCNENKTHEALDELFTDDAVSVEAMSMPNMPAEIRGLDGIKAKGKWWADNHVVHEAKADGPYPNGDRFAVRFSYDVTRKPTGERVKM